MTGRAGRPMEAVADGILEVSPISIYLWLLRTARIANPDPSVHIQSRFGSLLGRDGTFVSHIEAGRRKMPPEIRERWLTLIGLDSTDLASFLLISQAGRSPASRLSSPMHEVPLKESMALLDEALSGERLKPDQWSTACIAASAVGLPKTMRRFVRYALDATAATSGGSHDLVLAALGALPSEILIGGLRDSIESNPALAYHSVDLLGEMDSAFSGPMLRQYMISMHPFMERGVFRSVRRLAGRGEITSLADDPGILQEKVVDSVSTVATWMSRTELASLAFALGPMSNRLRNRLARHPDMDVRNSAGGEPEPDAIRAVRLLRNDAILAGLDEMYGAATEDPLAAKLAARMLLGREDQTRREASRALALSPYGAKCREVLLKLLQTSCPEVRRSSAAALMFFGKSHEASNTLAAIALADTDSSVRTQAMWTLSSNASYLSEDVTDRLLADRDTLARRAAIELCGSMKYVDGLLRAANDPDTSNSALAKGLASHSSASA